MTTLQAFGLVAQNDPDPKKDGKDDPDAKKDDSPEARYARRYPQPARVGDLIGWPVNDDEDRTLGHVRQIVRTPEGKILLIVSYSRWFGWFGHPVAVPLEVVAAYGRQLASLEMKPDQFQKAPTWVAGTDTPLKDDDTIRVALMRR